MISIMTDGLVESTPYKTVKIEGIRYSIEKVGYRGLEITMETQYKLLGLRMRVTSLHKVLIEEYGGPTQPVDRKYFLEPERLGQAEHWINEGIEIMSAVKSFQEGNLVQDIDDLDYRLMLMVGRIFQDWTNVDLPEPLEQELQMHNDAAEEQIKQEKEVTD